VLQRDLGSFFGNEADEENKKAIVRKIAGKWKASGCTVMMWRNV
jgi:hypothetical protein